MNKTSIVTKLPCGCYERRWLFGRDRNPGCPKCTPPRETYAWPSTSPSSPTSEADDGTP